MERCDVVVVGGGPAGSSCARTLHDAGLGVIVLDRAVFLRDKVCAGWITPQAIDELDLDPADYQCGEWLGLDHQRLDQGRHVGGSRWTFLSGGALAEPGGGSAAPHGRRRGSGIPGGTRRRGVLADCAGSPGALLLPRLEWLRLVLSSTGANCSCEATACAVVDGWLAPSCPPLPRRCCHGCSARAGSRDMSCSIDGFCMRTIRRWSHGPDGAC